MRRAIAVALVVVVGLLASTVAARAEVGLNLSEPIQTSVFVPCANGGLGEVVNLTGDLHVLVTLTVNENNVSGETHFQASGVRGVGASSGATFVGTGVTRQVFSSSLSNGHAVTSFVNNFRIIGQGSAPSYLVHETSHVTFGSDGSITGAVDNLSVDCK